MKPGRSKLFVALAGACAASLLLDTPAFAQSKVRLNIASSFALSLPLIGEVVPKLAQKVTRVRRHARAPRSRAKGGATIAGARCAAIGSRQR